MHDATDGGFDAGIARLIADCSLDMVGRHRDELPAAAALLPDGTRVHIGAARDESAAVHRATSAAVAKLGPASAARNSGETPISGRLTQATTGYNTRP